MLEALSMPVLHVGFEGKREAHNMGRSKGSWGPKVTGDANRADRNKTETALFWAH